MLRFYDGTEADLFVEYCLETSVEKTSDTAIDVDGH